MTIQTDQNEQVHTMGINTPKNNRIDETAADQHLIDGFTRHAATITTIDKKDRSTLQTFGGYIDTYTIEQAVADGATVPIFYESRLPELRILGNTLDASGSNAVARSFAQRSHATNPSWRSPSGTASSTAPRKARTWPATAHRRAMPRRSLSSAS